MKRKRSEKITSRDEKILNRIKEIKKDHPFWGYRRIWAHLKFVDGIKINKKPVLRIMRENQLLVHPNQRLKAKRSGNYRPKPRATAPNQWWGIDMTKVMVEGFGWMYVVIVLDWYTKKIVGHYLGLQSKSKHWKMALEEGLNQQFPQGAKDKGLNLMSDNGCQPTSISFMKDCSSLGIHQAFTSYNNPKGNADTERMIRTMKEECLWLTEWKSPFELATAFKAWVAEYNSNYLHSSLGYKSPRAFEMEYLNRHNTNLISA